MLDVQFGQASDHGKVLFNDEDAMGSFIPASRDQARSHGYLFAVAGGMGDMDLGAIAASMAVSIVTEEFSRAQPRTMLISLLPRLIQQANATIYNCALAPEYRGRKMAATMVVCALRYDMAVVSHVGDCRCYMVRNRQATLVTQDRTNGKEERTMNWPATPETHTCESRVVLIRSLGPEMVVSSNTTVLTLQAEDTLVLSTGRLHDKIAAIEIAELVSQRKSMDQIARELVARAIKTDGSGNTTAQVIRIRSIEQTGMYRGLPFRLQA